MGKTSKSHSRRRRLPGVSVTLGQGERPFGAMLHMDHIQMEVGSEASRAASYCLNVHDEKTDFFMAFPSQSRSAEAVLDTVHRFNDANPTMRRWWTDSAPEFAVAARTIRSTQRLAHYRSTRCRPQANGRAESKNRLAIEGICSLLMTRGLPERSWPLAITKWTAMYNATFRVADGFTP